MEEGSNERRKQRKKETMNEGMDKRKMHWKKEAMKEGSNESRKQWKKEAIREERNESKTQWKKKAQKLCLPISTNSLLLAMQWIKATVPQAFPTVCFV